MANTEWSKGRDELGMPSPRDRLGTLKALLGGLLPQRRFALRPSPRIALASEASRRSLVVAERALGTWKARAYEAHRRTSIR